MKQVEVKIIMIKDDKAIVYCPKCKEEIEIESLADNLKCHKCSSYFYIVKIVVKSELTKSKTKSKRKL